MARMDLSGIKTSIKTILDGANTTTGSPIDLSDSLVTRVNQVLQINVERIPVQPSFFPCITMFYESKSVELKDIGATMLAGKRDCDLSLKLVGIVWIDNMNTTNFQYKDLADNECEQLMENIEQVLRKDPTLEGKCLWSKTTEVTYHTFQVSEESHMRAGIMNYSIRALY
jgi:hypothetical protein